MSRNGFDAQCGICKIDFVVSTGEIIKCPKCGVVLVNGEWVKPPSAEAQEGAVRVTVAKEKLIEVE